MNIVGWGVPVLKHLWLHQVIKDKYFFVSTIETLSGELGLDVISY